MQKFWMILLAVLLATGLVFVGCDSSGGGDDDDDDTIIDIDLGAFELTVGANQYGGFQGWVEPEDLFDGYRIQVGDEFTLEVEFTTDRAITANDLGGLQIDLAAHGSVDWQPISWKQDASYADIDPTAISVADLSGSETKAISKTLTYTALARAPSAAAKDNAFVIQTKEDNDDYDEIVIKFTKFHLKKTGGTSGGGEGEGGGSSTPVVAIYGQADAGTVVLNGTTITVDWTATSGSWGFSVETPEGTTATSTVVISTTYTAGSEGTPAFIIKQGSGWTDLSTAKYPNFKDYSGVVSVDMSLFNADSLGKIFFQFNTGDNSDGADFELTIDSVSLE